MTTARTLWVPAVNNHGGFGRWAFVEVTDPWDAQRTIRAPMNLDCLNCGAVTRLRIEVFHELDRVDQRVDVAAQTL